MDSRLEGSAAVWTAGILGPHRHAASRAAKLLCLGSKHQPAVGTLESVQNQPDAARRATGIAGVRVELLRYRPMIFPELSCVEVRDRCAGGTAFLISHR